MIAVLDRTLPQLDRSLRTMTVLRAPPGGPLAAGLKGAENVDQVITILRRG